MNIFLGPYHPHLEDALAGEIRAERARDLLSPILVVVPSDALRRRIQILLAREHGLHLLNFRVHTFFQLTMTLHREAHGASGLSLEDDTFMEEALRRVVATRGRSLSFSGMLEEGDGACAALWQTLRDLKDGLVDPEVALEALGEGHFEPSDEAGLRELFTLYADVRTRLTEWGARDRADLDTEIEPFVDSSRYLAQFPCIYYYGFYDLTQIQLELFRSIARHYPVTLFFPLATGHPGWSFAERFYEQHLRGLAGTGAVVDLARGSEAAGSALHQRLFADPAAATPAVSPHSTIVSCSGARDEVLFAAKKTLELVDEHGLSFEEVGVVARTLDPYRPWLEEIFPEHGIPFNTSARAPLLLFNLVKALLLLVDLPVRGFPRGPVIDLLTSPYFKLPGATNGIEPRPDIWDVVTRALRITRGLSEWNRLERYLETGLTLRLGTDQEDGKPLAVPPEQMGALLGTVRILHERLDALPPEGKWSDLSERWRALIDEFIDCRRGAGEAPVAVQQAIDAILDGLAALEVVSPLTSLSYFTRSLHKQLARASIPVSDREVPGVHFLDAMSARGIPFRALLLLGMNEGVFPRTIREDPFLRDRSRRVLDAGLGFKISEKLGAYEEEKLLFSLLVGSASEHLYCIYQRSDSAGRPLAPSWYLGELQRRAGGPIAGAVTIPRGVLGKAATAPFDAAARLPPGELTMRLALSSDDPSPLIPLTGTLAEAYTRGVEAIRRLEDSESPAGAFDGLTGPLPEHWDRISTHGISPTRLETYGRCPFQYFARHALRLERLERPEALVTVEPVEMGKICHDILHRFYEEAGPTVCAMSPGERDSLFDRVAARVAADYEGESPTGYPVEWTVVKQALVDLLRQAIQADLEELEGSGFRPASFEMELGAHLGNEWPDDLEGLPIHGRLDRMDANVADRRIRVVDYKFKPGRRPNARDNDLVRAAIRGMQLQPPIYLLLAAAGAGSQPARPDAAMEAAFYFLAPRWDEGPLAVRSLSDQVWSEPAGGAMRQAIAQILRGIRQGEFFILPGDYCRFCEVSEICRKAHPPSRARAERHSGSEDMARMRKQT